MHVPAASWWGGGDGGGTGSRAGMKGGDHCSSSKSSSFGMAPERHQDQDCFVLVGACNKILHAGRDRQGL